MSQVSEQGGRSGRMGAPISSGRGVADRALRRGLVLVAVLVVSVAMVGTSDPAPAAVPTARAALGPLSHSGRWITDTQGRVVLTNGVNLVAKGPGVTPAEMGFDADDAAFLVESGFDTVRLGTTAASLMPEPGVIDTAYIDSFVATVDLLTEAGLQVLVDLHQDGWGPTLGSDGFPGWMTLTHGAENTMTEFPLYYVTNPAIQAAFDSFWANEVGPGGVPLQDRVAAMFTALAQRLSGHPGVLGYDLLNEPWPGTVWEACANDPGGCPAQDAALDAYYARMTAAIRAEDPSTLVFGEPYVLFNFGTAPTNVGLPGGDPASGLSYHVYTVDPALDPAVVDYAEQWADRTGGALLITEFGATTDVAAIDRQISLFESTFSSWMWWAYDENVIRDDQRPPTEDNLFTDVVDTLVRPHPRAVAGTPTEQSYDLAERVLRFAYSTDSVGGAPVDGLTTEIQVAPRTYPAGYRVEVVGGSVTSEPDAALLTVVADPGAEEVSVVVTPAGQPEPPDGLPPAPPAVPLPARPTFTG